eukprot:1146145-Pelagomonas_calceolata.AAC.4
MHATFSLQKIAQRESGTLRGGDMLHHTITLKIWAVVEGAIEAQEQGGAESASAQLTPTS